ncbi:hypothetical protein CCP3SC5AM1_200017 [Gammaproteobacteria bacterium]
MNPVEELIELHLRARFPLLWLQTYEEERALASLRQVRARLAIKKEIALFIWSETTGLRDEAGRRVTPQTNRSDPLLALEQVIQESIDAIYIFLDIHRHFTPVCLRLIRDAVATAKRIRKSMVFLGPPTTIPEELMADATLLFYPSPDVAALGNLVETIAAHSGGPSTEQPIKETLARAVLGLTSSEAERVLRRSLARHGELNLACVPDVLAEKEQIVRKEGILEFRQPEVSFADVGGLERLKEWFAQRRRAFDADAQDFGLRPPRGVVLVGVPGCGKSLSAKALAMDWQVPLLRLDLGRVYAALLGESELRLRRALHTAEVISPCILWIDELEKAFSGLGQTHDSGVARRLFGTFLTWLEDRQAPVFVIATANDIRRLPAEFTRKGRFDELFFVGLPGEYERRSIFSIHLTRRKRDPARFDLSGLVSASRGYSGAEIEEAIVSGLYRAFSDNYRELTNSDLKMSLAEIIPLAKTRADDLVHLEQWAAVNARSALAQAA